MWGFLRRLLGLSRREVPDRLEPQVNLSAVLVPDDAVKPAAPAVDSIPGLPDVEEPGESIAPTHAVDQRPVVAEVTVYAPPVVVVPTITVTTPLPWVPSDAIATPLLGLSIDVETTGLSARKGDRIISVSVVEVFSVRLGARFDVMVNPGRSIPADASDIHGIRDADVHDKPTFREIAADLARFVGDRATIGYNLGFDLGFLDMEFTLAGVTLPPGLLKPGCDVKKLSEGFRGGVRMRLHAACSSFGVDLSALQAHSAADDATATAQLLLAIRRQTAKVPLESQITLSMMSLAKMRAEERYYDDDDLEAGWILFETRRYDEALERVYAAITRDEMAAGPVIESRAYELACMILRRLRKRDDEVAVLRSFLSRAYGYPPRPGELADGIVRPWHPAFRQVPTESGRPKTLSTPPVKIGRRPAPEVAELAARLDGLFAKVETVREAPIPNGQRLARCRAERPYHDNLKELAVCLRREYSAWKSADQSKATDVLIELHAAAQRHAFIHYEYPGGRDDPELKKDSRAGLWSHLAAEIATDADLTEVVLEFRVVGYRRLPLLNKTDVSRLVATFGEPDDHLDVRVHHAAVWERLRKVARAQRKAKGF